MTEPISFEELVSRADKAITRTNNIMNHFRAVQAGEVKPLSPQDFDEWYCYPTH